MSVYTRRAPVTITCNKRLAAYVEQEVKALGFETEETFVTGIRLYCSINDCIRLNLNLRCVSQVLYSLKQFDAVNADDIYKNLVNYPWETILPDNGYFSVTSNVLNPTINNSMLLHALDHLVSTRKIVKRGHRYKLRRKEQKAD